MMNAISLNQLGNGLISGLAQLSVELAALSAFVLVVIHVFRVKSPTLRHLLWLAVLLKPIVATAIATPFSLFAPLTQAYVVTVLPAGSHEVGAPASLTSTGVTSEAIGSDLSLAGVLAILWLLGSALLMCRLIVGSAVIWRLRRRSLDERSGPLFNALQEACTTLDVGSNVDISTSTSIRSPIVVGILRPLILVPTDLANKLNAEGLKMILMHELAHVRRLDNLTLLVQRLVETALFFHPSVWLCGRMLHREAEQACDDLVVIATGRSEQYAQGLSSVAELSHLKRRLPAMSVFAAAESDLTLRIRRALNTSVYRMGIGSRIFAAVLLVVSALVTLPSCAENQVVIVKPKRSTDGEDVAVRKTAAASDTVLVKYEADSGAPVLYYNPSHLRKIATNPAGTNGERFVVASFSLAISGVEAIPSNGKQVHAVELTQQEIVLITKRLDQFATPMKAIALEELRSRTVEQLHENTESLTSALSSRIRQDVFAPFIADLLPDKRLMLARTLVTGLIVQ